MKLDQSIDVVMESTEVYGPSDDSYLMLKVIEVVPGERFLEIGCGAGLISLHAAKAGAEVVASDISPHAVECTKKNAVRNNLKMEVLRSDLFEKIEGYFDAIAFNPPYLPEETRSTSWIEKSWSGGSEGSEVAVKFLEEAWRHLAPGGRVYIILSSLGGFMAALKAAKEHYESQMMEEKHMFFESIYAYQLRAKSSLH